MKIIEEQIIRALRGGEGIKALSCRDCVKVEGRHIEYYLWDSLIFWNDAENNYYFSGRGYNSNTTKSRLNRLLETFCQASIRQKNWRWLLSLNDRQYPINAESIFCIKGEKLYNMDYEVEVLPLEWGV